MMKQINWKNEKISQFTLGAAQLGMDYIKPKAKNPSGIIAKALLGGINCFDTAQAYGDSENIINAMLENSSAKIVTKVYLGKKTKIKEPWCLMLHEPDKIDVWRPEQEAKYYGVSVYTPWQARYALLRDDIKIIQVPFNFLDREMLRAGIFELAEKLDKLCFIRSVFKRGLLAKPLLKKYMIKFVQQLNLPLVIGVETVKQLKQNLRYFNNGEFL